MNLEDLKEQLKDRWQIFSSTVQESSFYISAKERFENFPPRTQKLILFASTGIIIFLLVSIPLANFNGSLELEENFTEKQQLISDLLKSGQLDNAPSIPPPMPSSALEGRAQSILRSARLIPEQIKGVKNTSFETENSHLIPKSIDQQSVQVSIAKVNLKQIVNIAYQLSNMNRYIKLKDMTISPNTEDKGYSDATYTIVSLGLPPQKLESENKKSRKPRSRRRGRK